MFLLLLSFRFLKVVSLILVLDSDTNINGIMVIMMDAWTLSIKVTFESDGKISEKFFEAEVGNPG